MPLILLLGGRDRKRSLKLSGQLISTNPYVPESVRDPAPEIKVESDVGRH